MERSIGRDTTWFVLLTAGLALLTASGIWFMHSAHSRSHALKKLDTDVQSYTYAVEAHVEFYQPLLRGLAKRLTVQELLEFEDTDAAFAWAQGYRTLLPGAIGFGLISASGEVLGEPGALYIGPGCRADIQRLARGESIELPAVHREIEDLEHFDLVEPVTDINNRLLGYIFASFSLTVLSDFSSQLIRDGQRLMLHDGEQELIVVADRLNGESAERLELKRPLPLGNWTMSLASDADRGPDSLAIMGGAASLLALLIGAGVVFLSRRVSSGLVQEVRHIESALDDLVEGRSDVRIRARFRETKPLMDAVREISYRIQQQKTALVRLSETDELTGLMNRRRYTTELKKAWALAQRQVSTHIMCLDMDGFKQVNDRFGHGMGDNVLKQFSSCLKGCTRQSDLTARLGGDEFVILLMNSGPESGEDVFNRLGECFRRSQVCTTLAEAGVSCTLSAGLIRLDPDVDADVHAAMQRVDAALYRAKHSGRSRLCMDCGPETRSCSGERRETTAVE